MKAVLRSLSAFFSLAVPPRLAFLPAAVVGYGVGGEGGEVFWICVGVGKQSTSARDEGRKKARKLASHRSHRTFLKNAPGSNRA